MSCEWTNEKLTFDMKQLHEIHFYFFHIIWVPDLFWSYWVVYATRSFGYPTRYPPLVVTDHNFNSTIITSPANIDVFTVGIHN